MVKKDLIIIADYSEETILSLQEICDLFDMTPDVLNDFIEYDVITPIGSSPETWIFDLDDLRRINATLRLQRDLEINLAGIALILNLRDELEELRKKSTLLEKHLLK